VDDYFEILNDYDIVNMNLQHFVILFE